MINLSLIIMQECSLRRDAAYYYRYRYRQPPKCDFGSFVTTGFGLWFTSIAVVTCGHVNDQLVINCNDSRHSCLMLITV